MPYTYTLTTHADYIRFDERGAADTIDDARQFGLAAVREAEENKCSRLLFDERVLKMNLTPQDVYALAEEFSLIVPAAGLRIAALHSSENREIGGVFETMLQNRSVNYRSFELEEDAIAWLTT